jgi:UDP-glucuronate decarboxylase
MTIRDTADLILQLTGSSSVIQHLPLPQDDPMQRRPDITRARTLLQWEPTVPLQQGLLHTIQYFQTHPINTQQQSQHIKNNKRVTAKIVVPIL